MTETAKTDKATVYEVGFHIVPTVSPENLPKEVDAIKAILEKEKATIISEEFPKLRTLAYEMVKAVGQTRNKFDSAYFGWIKFEGSTNLVAELNKALTASEKILRFLIVKTVRENTLYGSKILALEKDEKDEKEEKAEAPAEEGASTPSKSAQGEELDKSIDKLVA